MIEATSRRLWEEDESELRITDICQETNPSTSVIYGNFRSRQGLINASLLHIFALVTDEVIENLAATASHSRSAGSFLDTLFNLRDDADYQTRLNRQRQMFFRVSATALSRPRIRPGFLELYDRYIKRADAIYEELLEGASRVQSSRRASGRCSSRARCSVGPFTTSRPIGTTKTTVCAVPT